MIGGVRLTLDPAAGSIHAVATDSYRLAVYQAEGCAGDALEVTVPGRMLTEVLRLAKGKGAGDTVSWSAPESVGHEPLFVGFTVGNVELVGRKIEGQFPDWRRSRPDSFELEVSLSGAEIAAAGKRIGALAKGYGRGAPARFGVDAETGAVTLGIQVMDCGSASEVLPTPAVAKWSRWNAKAKGEPAPAVRTMPEVGLNAAFLQDAVAFCGETVRMQLLSPLRPVLFLNGREDCWHLLMPVRIAG